MTMRPNALCVSRRAFLRRASALSILGSAAPLALNLAALGNAAAQSASDYKALVCVFLYGGNDAYNTVLATDNASWANYQAVRNQAPDSIALHAPGVAPLLSAQAGSPDRLGGVLPLSPLNAQGRSFALHPMLTGLRDLFAAGRLAIVPNVGPLRMPTTKTQYSNSAHPKPAKLFSHNDQQSTWQALATEGATSGWGGRLADVLAEQNAQALFTSISASGNALWLSGQQTFQYQVSTQGALRIGGAGSSKLFGSAQAHSQLHAIMSRARSARLLEQDHAAVVARAIAAENSLSAALPAAGTSPYGTPNLASGQTDPLLQYLHPISGSLALNPLAQQLQIVARLIGARHSLGTKRQVFFVSLGGFDTHDGQNAAQAVNLARLSHALQYFDNTLNALGVGQDVTTWTASDFGRTFTSNGDGTDHGWGAHHFVMGGAVKGGDLYGAFPTYGLPVNGNDFSSPDQIRNGVLIPQTSVDQYGATLGQWLGLSASQLLDIFPNLNAFDVSARNLGFMHASPA